MIRASGNKGVILIALLWVLTAMSIIALSFSRESFVEIAVARNSRDLADAYYIARAGISATVYQLLHRRITPALQRLELQGPPDPLDLGKASGRFGDGEYLVDIQDETGKINLNFVGEDQLRTLMDVIGIDRRDGDVIVDSIMDWKDVDKMHRINGAEDDFYQSLNPPYLAKNGRFETAEELLLVRGVTRDYFYGRSERLPDGNVVFKFGLSRYLTVYSTSNRINVNNAPLEVLMSVPGMPPQSAQMIFQRRQVKPFTTLEEINRELPVNLGPMALPFLSTDQSGTYTLTASGRRDNSKVRRVIRAVVTLDSNETNRYKVIYWNENVPVL